MTKDLFIKISLVFFIFFSFKENLFSKEYFLPEIKVTGEKKEVKEGNVVNLDRTKNLPLKNSSVVDIVKTSPMARTSNDSDSPFTGGEILPERISISGGKFYDNNFNIDGLKMDSWLDPSSDATNSVTDIPNHFTSILPDVEIFDSVIMYDHDVPVRYGGFAGGVVDCKTKSSSEKLSGSVNFISTRSEWTSFHLKDNLKNEFEKSDSDLMQPEFRKYRGSFDLSGPVSENTGFVLNYSEFKSDIPLQYFKEYKNQHRLKRSLYGKFDFKNDIHSGMISVLYSPYQGDFFLPNSKNSDYKLSQTGLAFSGEDSFFVGDKKITFKTSYKSTDYKRDADNIWYKWAATKSVPWGLDIGETVSKEGGFGKIEKNESSIDTNLIIEGDEYHLGDTLSNRPEFGFFHSSIKGEESRAETAYLYSSPVYDNPFFKYDDGDKGFIPGEQYFSKRLVYSRYKGSADMNYYGLFLQDEIFFKNLFIRAGLRFSQDDFLENLNISRRVLSKLTFFDGKAGFSFGYNRYYSHGFLQQKLKESRGTVYKIESRTTYENSLTDWVEDSSSPYRLYKFSNLKTPYTDEYTLGMDFKVAGKRFELGYIRRYFKDQFASSFGYNEDKYTVYTYNNNGKSEFEGLKLTGELVDIDDFNLSFNLSWQHTLSFVEDYESNVDEETSSELVYYDGKLMFRDEMAANNYNAPFTASIIFYRKIFGRVDLSSIIRYRSRLDLISNTGDTMEVSLDDRINPDTGEPYKEIVSVYENKNTDDKITMDINLGIPVLIHRKYKAGIVLNIYNLFDYGKEVDDKSVKPYMGRQIWAGVRFDF